MSKEKGELWLKGKEIYYTKTPKGYKGLGTKRVWVEEQENNVSIDTVTVSHRL